MAMEALPSNDFLNFLIYDTLSATPIFHHVASSSSSDTAIAQADPQPKINDVGVGKKSSLGVQGVGAKKKKRKRARSCKNKEEAETQRMTHIVVERNRRKQMNEHLSVLRSLMPQSYAQRGDQASIVGGAIEFVKELEHILQSLEAQKSQADSCPDASTTTPFSQFFTCPQYTWSQSPNEYTAASSKAAIEVTLIETHANIRILSKRSPKQPYKIVFSFQAVHLTILHLSITTMDSLVFYSISAKVEEGCPLNSVDDIAGAVHHMLRIIEQEEDAVDVDVDVDVAGLCS